MHVGGDNAVGLQRAELAGSRFCINWRSTWNDIKAARNDIKAARRLAAEYSMATGRRTVLD
jgi:hypothetical protein